MRRRIGSFCPPRASNSSEARAPPPVVENARQTVSREAATASTHALDSKENVKQGNQQDRVDSEGRKCFSVYYTARSNKKRKVFDDGFIEIKDRTVRLYDTEGKLVSKSRCTDNNLASGVTMDIGSKEVEIADVVPESQFTSGKVFLGSNPAPAGISSNAKSSRCIGDRSIKRSFSKPFAVPIPGNKPSKSLSRKSLAGGRNCMRRVTHSHTRENALVLYEKQSNQPGGDTVRVVVDPILGDILRPHQREGVQFLFNCTTGDQTGLSSNLGCVLADEMCGSNCHSSCHRYKLTDHVQGLGKTLQVITLVWTLLRQGISPTINFVHKAVIVCPASLVHNWAAEFRKWLGPQRIQPVVVRSEGKEAVNQKLKEFTTSSLRPVLIISYETYRSSSSTLNNVKGFDLLVVDEGHRLKSSKGNQTIRALNAAPTLRRVLLTGTPVQNSMDEFYAMVSFVNPTILGNAVTFRRVFQLPIQQGRDRDSTPDQVLVARARAQELKELTQTFVLRRCSDILSKFLPNKVSINIFLRMVPTQAKLYRDTIESAKRTFSSTGSSSTTLQLITTLKQICTHPQLAATELTRVPSGASAKFIFLREFLTNLHAKAPTDRIVLVSNYTTTLDQVECVCRELNAEFVRLDGKTKGSQRESIVRKFNNPRANQISVLLLSSKAGGCGLNLIGANRIMLIDPDWNPATDLQAMARVWREGQQKKVFIYRLFATGSIEERILQRQLLKNNMSSVVDDSKSKSSQSKSFKSSFTREELRELFNYNEATPCHTYDILSNGDRLLDQQHDTSSHSVTLSSKSSVTLSCSNVSVGSAGASSDDEELAFPDLLDDQDLPKEQGSNLAKHPSQNSQSNTALDSSQQQNSSAVRNAQLDNLSDSDDDDLLRITISTDGVGSIKEKTKNTPMSSGTAISTSSLESDDDLDFSSPKSVQKIFPDSATSATQISPEKTTNKWKQYNGPEIDLTCDPPLQHTATKLPKIVTWVNVEEYCTEITKLTDEYDNIDALEF